MAPKSKKTSENPSNGKPNQNELLSSIDFLSNFSNAFFWKNKIDKSSDILELSPNAELVTGYSVEQILNLLGRKWGLVFEDDSYRIRKSFADFQGLSGTNEIEFIYRLVKKNKEIIWVKERIIAERNKSNNSIIFSGSILDITKEKSNEEYLNSKISELSNVNASKDKFISMLSHDLRSPFTSILGFSEILMNEPNLTESDKKEYLTYIHSSSQNQLQFINYLLDWSRLQTGRIKVEPQRLNLQNIVYSVISSLTGNIIRKNLNISVDIPHILHVKADERLLVQVIANLLSNAVKFSTDHKAVRISAEIFNENKIEIIIKDEGIGISEKNQQRLFRMERLFSTEGTKGEKGTGLGLSLVKEIVEKHNCEVWFYSEKGKGSEFHFTMPYSQNSILIVDSKKIERNKCIEIIKDRFPFYEIVEAENGYEAIDLISTKYPSLVITAYEMPLMTGVQLIQTLKNEEKNHRIPFIALLRKDLDKVKKEFEQAGVKAVIQLPLDEDLFLNNLNSLLN